MATLCGGTGGAREPSSEERQLLSDMRQQVEAKVGKQFDCFEPLLVATQVVAGTNYFAKVRVASEEFVHIRVYKPLPHTQQQPELHGVQTGKAFADAVEHFQQE